MRFPPVGLSEIVATYGDPRDYILDDGTISPEWESERLTLVTLPLSLPLGWDLSKKVGRIRVHKLAAESFEDAFDAIAKDDLWPKLRTFDGTVSYRSIRGKSRLSTHAWGISADLDASTNQLGQRGDIHPGVVERFKAAGFTWGGDFARLDMMHFQLASGY